jgi:cytochrome b6
MGFIYDWCEERLEIQSIADDILAKFVPAHVNIFYCFGGIMVTSFIFQGGSGFALTIYYQPTVVEAFPSVQQLLYHVNLGWFIKSIHRWSSGVMVLILILHIARVYLTGGFKKPRELIWITGIILAVTTVSFGVTGYSLPWDQIGYWACKIVTSVPIALDNLIPGIGKISVLTLRGGFSVNQSTLTRLYSIHTFGHLSYRNRKSLHYIKPLGLYFGRCEKPMVFSQIFYTKSRKKAPILHILTETALGLY